MFETSTVSTNLNPVFVVRMPEPSSLRLLFNSLNHIGWVKSPVPRRSIPLIRAYFSRFSRSRFFEVARLYLEWRCKSAIIPRFSIFIIMNVSQYLNNSYFKAYLWHQGSFFQA